MSETEIVVRNTEYLTPVVDIVGALARYEAMNKFIVGILKAGTDYGMVPGSDKPTLFKPGAEKLASFFGLTPRFSLTESIEDWTGADHGGQPLFYYRYKCQLFKGDYLIAEGEGSCNSWEKKYRYRQGMRKCPKCGQPAIFKSKNKPEWYCWSKKGGCGSTFKLDDKSISEQDISQTINPDPAEQINTIQKMAQKRALVAPVLIATNASERFTQDIEDFVEADYRDIQEPIQPKTTYQSSPQKTAVQDEPKHAGAMTYEQAAQVKGSNGESYGDLTDAELTGKRIGITKILNSKDVDPAKQSAALNKLEAINVLLAVPESERMERSGKFNTEGEEADN